MWDEGLNMLGRIVDGNYDNRKKMALQTALHIRKEDNIDARRLINILEYDFKNKLPLEIILMDSYLSLKEADQSKLFTRSSEACSKRDGLNCWLLSQTLSWENLGKTFTREDKTLSKTNFDVEVLKYKTDIIPLEESVFIDQKDIQELDGNDLPLVK